MLKVSIISSQNYFISFINKSNSTNELQIYVEFSDKYKQLFFNLELYNIQLKKIIDDLDKNVLLIDKIKFNNKLDKLAKEIKEIEEINLNKQYK